VADLQQLFPGKAFISTILEALDTKTEMTGELRRRYLQRAVMAGVLIGILYVTHFAVYAAVELVPIGDPARMAPFAKVIAALVFGWALVFIYYSRSELLTSNMMIVSIGGYFRRTTPRRALRILGLCFLGNALGGLVVAALLAFSSIISDASFAIMVASVDTKLSYLDNGAFGIVDLLVRATLCNFMINMGMLLVYNGRLKDDRSKMTVMLVSVFVFVLLGLEHSVANTVLFEIVALQDGAAVPLGPALGNIGLALIGNFIGGGILIGLYYAYVNDDTRYLRAHPEAGAPPG
jgi:formate/nitrite transporter FocA (FNT family)